MVKCEKTFIERNNIMTLIIDTIARILVVVGAINWAFFAFGINLVTLIVGPGLLARIVYILVGIAGAYLIRDIVFPPKR